MDECGKQGIHKTAPSINKVVFITRIFYLPFEILILG